MIVYAPRVRAWFGNNYVLRIVYHQLSPFQVFSTNQVHVGYSPQYLVGTLNPDIDWVIPYIGCRLHCRVSCRMAQKAVNQQKSVKTDFLRLGLQVFNPFLPGCWFSVGVALEYMMWPLHTKISLFQVSNIPQMPLDNDPWYLGGCQTPKTDRELGVSNVICGEGIRFLGAWFGKNCILRIVHPQLSPFQVCNLRQMHKDNGRWYLVGLLTPNNDQVVPCIGHWF